MSLFIQFNKVMMLIFFFKHLTLGLQVLREAGETPVRFSADILAVTSQHVTPLVITKRRKTNLANVLLSLSLKQPKQRVTSR